MKKIIILLIVILNSIVLNAQVQIGQDINGFSDAYRIGTSLALSTDGQIMAIGSGFDLNNGSVSVYQYNESNNTWEQIGNTIYNYHDDSSAFFGTVSGSISLSADGTRLAVGAQDSSFSFELFNNGSTYVYDYNGTNWVQFGDTIEGTIGAEKSGGKVSLSANGNRLAVGSFKKTSIYESNGTGWDLIATFNDDQYSYPDLSADGNKVLIANHSDNNFTGKVRVLEQSGSDWIPVGQILYGESEEDRFGSSFSLTEDGNTIAIGAPALFNDSNLGSVKIYNFNGASWEQLGQDLNGANTDDYFGYSVSLTTSGINRLVIGIPRNDDGGEDSGKIQIFDYDGTNWVQVGENIIGLEVNDKIGNVIYLSENGLFLAVGTPRNNGKAKVYDLSNVNLSINDFMITKKNYLYPNPTTSTLTLMDKDIKVEYVTIYDNIGRLVKKTFFKNNEIDLSNLTTGLYYIKLNTHNNTITNKVLKN